MSNGKFVAYYRVSTAKQGQSGLGLEAQREAVRSYLNGGSWSLVAEFRETESGKRSNRPALQEALAACRLHKATLIIAKLDRLARNVAFVSALMEAGVEFVAADFPQANRLTVHILASVAEHEGRMISERTKAALRVAKERGVRLGGDRGGRADDGARALAKAAIRKSADDRAAIVLPTIRTIQAAGTTSLRGIAEALNDQGIPSSRGGRWQAISVRRVLSRTSA